MALLLTTLCVACAAELPDDVARYREQCVRMNAAPIPAKPDDPHDGVKDVFACNVPEDTLVRNARPFPDGSIIVKESTREDAAYPWLVATARKAGGKWVWNEYSRNFENEPFVEILPSEQVCIDCHQKAQALDWIYTTHQF